jgi:FMN reductase
MSELNVVIVSGNLGTPSKTLALGEQIAEAVEARAPGRRQVFQLGELAPAIGSAITPHDVGGAGRRALRAIEAADILIAVTPVYKGSYTGLFKHLFDLLDPTALSDVPVILGATGGGDKHALVLEHQLRPLFGFFGAATAAAGVYAGAQLFDGRRFEDPTVIERIQLAARQAVDLARLRAERGRQVKAA